MAFKSEAELRDHLSLSLPFDSEKGIETYVRREVRVGTRVPDIVYVRMLSPIDSGWRPARWSYRFSCVLWELRSRGPLSLYALSAYLFEVPARMANTVAELVKLGGLKLGTNGLIRLSESAAETRAEIIAFETKLKRWREALRQAVSYVGFADQVAVALDGDQCRLNPEVDLLFAEAGIGLMEARPGELVWRVQPRGTPREALGPEREYILGSALSRRGQTLWSLRNPE